MLSDKNSRFVAVHKNHVTDEYITGMCAGRCKSPPVVPHATHNEPPLSADDEDASWGEVQGRLYRLGTELIYKCLTGYYIDGYYKSTCLGEGHWVGPTMRCLR